MRYRTGQTIVVDGSFPDGRSREKNLGVTAYATGFNLGVSADSQNKEAAYLFVQLAASPENSSERVKLQYALRATAPSPNASAQTSRKPPTMSM